MLLLTDEATTAAPPVVAARTVCVCAGWRIVRDGTDYAVVGPDGRLAGRASTLAAAEGLLMDWLP